MLSEADHRFIEERRRRNRFGRPAMVGVLLLWAGLWAGLVIKVPLLANPFHVLPRLRADELEPSTVATLAAMCPLLFAVVGFLVLAFSLLALFWVGLERRYLDMLASPSRETAVRGGR